MTGEARGGIYERKEISRMTFPLGFPRFGVHEVSLLNSSLLSLHVVLAVLDIGQLVITSFTVEYLMLLLYILALCASPTFDALAKTKGIRSFKAPFTPL